MMKCVEVPVHDSETKARSKTDKPWQVVLLDDSVNEVDYVTWILMKVFGYSREKATALMMTAHQEGRSIVWMGGREKGEMYVNQLHSAQLRATIEKAE